MKRRPNRGFSLLETVLTLGILGGVLVFFGALSNTAVEWLRNRAAAGHLIAVHRAATQYVQQNFGGLLSSTASGPVAITVPALITAGMLPPTFPSNNVYGQQATLIVTQPTAQTLQALVVTMGGTTLSDIAAASVATRIGSAGGYISKTNPAVAQGPFGSVGLAAFAATGVALQPGHIAAEIHFSRSTVLADYLYRFQVPGLPEANRMSAPLDMAGSSITNADDITATTLTATQNIAAAQNITAGGSLSAGGDINATNNIQSGQNISAASTITANLDLVAGRNVSAANSIVTQSAAIGSTLSAGTVSATSGLFANTVQADTLSSSSVSAGAIQASSATADTITATTANVTALNAGNLTTQSDMMVGGNLSVGQGMTVGNTISAPSATIGTAAVQNLITQSCTRC